MTELKVFTTTGCANCMQVKDYLKKACIEFTECNIVEDPQAAEELKRLGALSVPLIVCGDTVIHGFDRARLDELIASLTAVAV